MPTHRLPLSISLILIVLLAAGCTSPTAAPSAAVPTAAPPSVAAATATVPTPTAIVATPTAAASATPEPTEAPPPTLAPTAAQPALDDQAYALPLPDAVLSLAVEGEVAYAATPFGLRIFSVAAPEAMAPLGELSFPAGGMLLTVAASTVYLVDGDWTLQVMDASDPAAPRKLASLALGEEVRDLRVAGGYLYLATWETGLLVVAVTEPAAPRLAGRFDLENPAEGLALDGDSLYLTDSLNLSLLDVSDPAAPRLAGRFAFELPPGMCMGIGALAVLDGYAFLSDNCNGLWVVDARDPAAVQLAGELPLAHGVARMALAGSTLYVASWNAGLAAIDVTDPSAPAVLGYFVRPEYSGLAAAAPDGSTVFTTDSSLWALPVDPAGRPAAGLLSAEPVGGPTVAGAPEPLNVQLIGSLELDDTLAVAALGQTVYVGAGDRLACVDAADPTSLRLLGKSPALSGRVRAVQVVGERAFVAVARETGGGALAELDVANPARPVTLARLELPGYPVALALDGDWAYLAARDGGLHILDLARPEKPALVTTIEGWTQGVAIDGRYLYLALGFGGVAVYDISDPAHPKEAPGAREAEMGGHPPVMDVAVGGDGLLYAAMENAGIQVYDLTNPGRPIPAGGQDTAAMAIRVAAARGRAYLAGGDGLLVFTFPSPQEPALVAAYSLGMADMGMPTVWDVAPFGQLVYLATVDGLLVVQIK